MQMKPVVLALVADAADEEAWLQVLAAIPDLLLLHCDENLSRSLDTLQGCGLTAGLALISTRAYRLENDNPLAVLRHLFSAVQVVLFSAADTPLPSLRLLINDAIHHLVIESAAGNDGTPAASPLKLAAHNLLTDRPWQMSDYLLSGTTAREFAIHSSDQKEPVIASLMEMIGGDSPELELLRQKGALLADEMLENAMYAAPIGNGGGRLFRKGERRRLLPAEQITFRAGFDGMNLALEVIDNWGSLPSASVIEYLARHQDGNGAGDEKGGRGLFIIWRFLDQLHVTIAPGRQTVVGGHIRLNSTCDPLAPKGFHILTGCQGHTTTTSVPRGETPWGVQQIS
jgi:hypothetical protein